MLLPIVHGLVPTPECQVVEKDGHLHLTSVASRKQLTECTLIIPETDAFIEIERYSGRHIDEHAWLNVTLDGESPLTISIGLNRILVVGESATDIGIPTTTSLEKSMWLHIHFEPTKTYVQYAPPQSPHFGRVLDTPRLFSRTLHFRAFTDIGMEQMIRTVTENSPHLQEDSAINKKTIHELERRIRMVEKELKTIHSTNEKQDNLHQQHWKASFEHRRNLDAHAETLNERDHREDIARLQSSIFKYTWVLAIIVVIGIYISWRMYKRQQKLSRWTL